MNTTADKFTEGEKMDNDAVQLWKMYVTIRETLTKKSSHLIILTIKLVKPQMLKSE